MKLFVTVRGQPSIVVGYGPGKGEPKAIVMGLAAHPVAVSLNECIFPKLPRKLERKIKAWARRETQDAIAEVSAAGGGQA